MKINNNNILSLSRDFLNRFKSNEFLVITDSLDLCYYTHVISIKLLQFTLVITTRLLIRGFRKSRGVTFYNNNTV